MAWGAPAASTTGYTFQTLCERQIKHIKFTRGLTKAMQDDMLPHAAACFETALRLIESNLRLFLDTPEPATTQLFHLMAFDEAYDRSLDQKIAALQPLLVVPYPPLGTTPRHHDDRHTRHVTQPTNNQNSTIGTQLVSC